MDPDAELILQVAFLSIASIGNLSALVFFIYHHYISPRRYSLAFILQIMGHSLAAASALIRMQFVLGDTRLGVRIAKNFIELFVLTIQNVYYFEIFKVFGTFEKSWSLARIRRCQIYSVILCFLFGGGGLFVGISFNTPRDPGFLSKWFLLSPILFVCTPVLAFYVSYVAFKCLDRMGDNAVALYGRPDALSKNLWRMRMVLLGFVIMLMFYMVISITNGILAVTKVAKMSLAINTIGASILSTQLVFFSALVHLFVNGVKEAKQSNDSDTL